MGGTIVCGVTESAKGRGAAELAGALGERLDLRVVLVCVVDGVPRGYEESLTTRQRVTGADRMLRACARELWSETDTRVLLGDPAETLARVAAEEGADIVVLGSRGAGLGGRRLSCSLARQLETETGVPILVAPPATRRRSGRRLAAASAALTR